VGAVITANADLHKGKQKGEFTDGKRLPDQRAATVQFDSLYCAAKQSRTPQVAGVSYLRNIEPKTDRSQYATYSDASKTTNNLQNTACFGGWNSNMYLAPSIVSETVRPFSS
jgi:hypothetical protein